MPKKRSLSKKLSRKRRCMYGVKLDGVCKKKSGAKRSRRRSKRMSRRRSKRTSRRRSKRRSRKLSGSNKKRCAYGVKLDGACKKKTGAKRSRRR